MTKKQRNAQIVGGLVASAFQDKTRTREQLLAEVRRRAIELCGQLCRIWLQAAIDAAWSSAEQVAAAATPPGKDPELPKIEPAR